MPTGDRGRLPPKFRRLLRLVATCPYFSILDPFPLLLQVILGGYPLDFDTYCAL